MLQNTAYHPDLKPANLLVNSDCDLKICDFGFARSVASVGQNYRMTDYVATRWYRAPEVMLSASMYTKAIDMWSVRCILGELLSRLPLFPGKDYCHQLDLILDVLGIQSHDNVSAIHPLALKYMRTLRIQKRNTFSTLFPSASSDTIDFLAKTLMFSPTRRISAVEALNHPFLTAYVSPFFPSPSPLCPFLSWFY
ncbi:mitogen-activated protein kinase-2 [Mycena leptocephala]|nr:mitogen-activated protein kinase-2 [Mycena leptocephala]